MRVGIVTNLVAGVVCDGCTDVDVDGCNNVDASIITCTRTEANIGTNACTGLGGGGGGIGFREIFAFPCPKFTTRLFAIACACYSRRCVDSTNNDAIGTLGT